MGFAGRSLWCLTTYMIVTCALMAVTARAQEDASPAAESVAPMVSVDSPADGSNTNQVAVDVTVSFAAHKPAADSDQGATGNVTLVELLLDGQVVADFTNPPQTKSGTHTFPAVDLSAFANTRVAVRIQARAFQGDPRARLSRLSAPALVIVDTIAPITDILEPIDGSFLNDPRPSLAAAIVDNGGAGLDPASLVATLDGVPVDIVVTPEDADTAAIGFTPDADLAEGEHTYTVEAADLTGNAAAVAATTFLIDLSPPVVADLTPNDGAVVEDARPTINATVTDTGGAGLDPSTIVMTLDGASVAADVAFADPDTATLSFTPASDLDEGEHAVTVDASDLAGNVALTATSTFTLDLTPPPPTVVLSATMTAEPAVTVSGTAPRAATVRITGGAAIVDAPVSGETFVAEVTLQQNRINHLFVTGFSPGGKASPAVPATVTHDGQPPSVFIDFPADGAEITTEVTDVAGRVGDLLSGFMGLTVTVNGVAAVVDVGIGNNGTFLAPAVPLGDGGPVAIVATATDELGNSVTKQISVTRITIPPDAPRMEVASGNGQTGQVNTVLPAPIVVRMTRGDGSPFVGKIVTFDVTRSDGRLTADGLGPGSMMLQARTDADGLAQAFWKLGLDAGCGNNRVAVASRSIAGTVAFCATGTPAPARQINIGSGNSQRGEAGAPAPEPLRVWVSDACNGVADIPVTFAVLQGVGTVDGESETTVITGRTGHAEVELILGPDRGNNIVRADFPDNPNGPAVFTVFGVVRDETQPTRFAGLLLDNANRPIEGAACTLIVAGGSGLETATDAAGQFRFADIAGSGQAELFIDGLTATALDGQPIPPGSFPFLRYEPVVVPNAENSLPTPVRLPQLDPANARTYDGTRDVELTVNGIDGLKMLVKAGSMTRADGTKPSPADPAILALNQVHFDDVPMPMPDGAAPPFAWTLQPAGATFDPPVQITYPNMSGLPAGAIAYFLSFNHDTNRFEIVATGQVTPDALSIVSDPGAGIRIAGWGCNCPPYAVTGRCRNCFELAVLCFQGGTSSFSAGSGMEQMCRDVRNLAPMRITSKFISSSITAQGQLDKAQR